MKPRQSRNAGPARIRWQGYAVAALVLVAILFGGGGAEGHLNNGLIQALSAMVFALLLASHVRGSWPLPKAAAGATWLLLALVMIVLVQLAPLPPAAWRSLPGRELAESTLALVGSLDKWRPISLDPEATRRFAAWLLLPSAVLYGLLGATRREAALIVRAVVIAAGVSALIGALQLTLGHPGWLTYYDGRNPGAASGVFANANHQAALLAGALLFLGFLIRAGRSIESGGSAPVGFTGVLHPGWLALPFFAVIILATASRAGVVLLLLAAPGTLLIALGRRSPLLWLGGLAALTVVLAATVLLSPSGNRIAIGQSFMFSEDLRYAFLPDVLYTLQQYWPWGSGLGTFVPVFAPNENLDFAGAGYVNHAHNDLLEWLIETGVVGAMWLSVAAAVLLWCLGSAALKRNQMRGIKFAAVLTGSLFLLLVSLHSLIDYPLRTAAISAVTAIAVGLMFSPLTDAPPRLVDVGSRSRWPLVAASVAGLVLGMLALRIFAAEAAVRDNNAALALALRPQNGRALALAADEQSRIGNLAAARQLARAAVDRAPLAARAIRVLARAAPTPSARISAWRIASAMGWRDGPTQLWAFQQAFANAEFSVAAVRADALLRTRVKRRQEFSRPVRVASVEPHFRAALVKRLKLHPPWRRPFFSVPPETAGAELQGTYAVLQDLAKTRDRPTRTEARGTIHALLRQRQYQRAIDLYGDVLGRPRSADLVDDLHFGRSTAEYFNESTFFDWVLSKSAATVEGSGSERRLIVETDGLTLHEPVRRLLPLGPGRYQLTYRMQGEADADEAFAMSVRCVEDTHPIRTTFRVLPGSSGERRGLLFSVPEDCPLVRLALVARPVGYPAEAAFSDLSLRRI